MTERKNLKIDPETYRMLKNVQKKRETWADTFERLVEGYESEGKKWTESEIKDIVDRRIKQLRR